MKVLKLKLIMTLLVGAMFVMSCNEDSIQETVTVDEFRGDGRGGQGGSGNTGNDSNTDIDIRELDLDILSDWNALLLSVEPYASGMRPNAAARAFAYIYLSSYETAVPNMRNYESMSRRYNGFDIRGNINRRDIDWELALNQSFFKSIDHFLINLPESKTAEISAFALEQETILSADLSQREINASKSWGNYVAGQVISYSQTDSEAEQQILNPQPQSYEPPTGAGYWTYSAEPERALFPYWESVRTFVISPEQTSTVAPIAYSNNSGSPYFAQMNEVYEVNNSAKADQGEELHIAEFWSDDVEELMISPPARQISIANQLINQENMNMESALAMFLKLGFSLNDAAVSTWKYKYEHMVMRPNVFIHEYIDPSFQTNLYRLVYWPNPSFPGYPSGHSCFASAAAGVFIDYFGDEVNFTDRTHEGRTEFLGDPRSFNTLSDMAEENAFSRIPLGVHVRMDCEEGIRLGYEISDAVNDFRLDRRNQ